MGKILQSSFIHPQDYSYRFLSFFLSFFRIVKFNAVSADLKLIREYQSGSTARGNPPLIDGTICFLYGSIVISFAEESRNRRIRRVYRPECICSPIRCASSCIGYVQLVTPLWDLRSDALILYRQYRLLLGVMKTNGFLSATNLSRYKGNILNLRPACANLFSTGSINVFGAERAIIVQEVMDLNSSR